MKLCVVLSLSRSTKLIPCMVPDRVSSMLFIAVYRSSVVIDIPSCTWYLLFCLTSAYHSFTGPKVSLNIFSSYSEPLLRPLSKHLRTSSSVFISFPNSLCTNASCAHLNSDMDCCEERTKSQNFVGFTPYCEVNGTRTCTNRNCSAHRRGPPVSS